ncbi:hypothetical protein SNE40_023455 [Patella caerulea]|uniref:Uncharacterized protein n=1 Tax=Patella caerulea TaxID=87958 RepID=A0AAN8G785_PATCE
MSTLFISLLVISLIFSTRDYTSPVQAALTTEVTCPHLPCPWPGTCENPRQTWFDYKGKKCPGCKYCDKQVRRDLQREEYVRPAECPLFKCRDPGCSRENYVWRMIDFNGVSCRGCPDCKPL